MARNGPTCWIESAGKSGPLRFFPSPGIPGEDRGGGFSRCAYRIDVGHLPRRPPPNPPPEYQGRGLSRGAGCPYGFHDFRAHLINGGFREFPLAKSNRSVNVRVYEMCYCKESVRRHRGSGPVLPAGMTHGFGAGYDSGHRKHRVWRLGMGFLGLPGVDFSLPPPPPGGPFCDIVRDTSRLSTLPATPDPTPGRQISSNFVKCRPGPRSQAQRRAMSRAARERS